MGADDLYHSCVAASIYCAPNQHLLLHGPGKLMLERGELSIVTLASAGACETALSTVNSFVFKYDMNLQ